MGFRLARLEAAGFRGINRPLDLTLSPGLTVIVGRNGSGKSSLLQAVEWALFGTLPEGGYAEFRREDAIVNAFSSQSRARVRLTLAEVDRNLTVERTRRLGRSTTGRSDLVVRADGQVWRDGPAQEALDRILHLSIAEFHSAVTLAQDTSRALAGADHEERAATIDRLLGIAALRDLVANLSTSQVSREVNRVAQQIEAQRAAGLTTAVELRRLLTQREDTLAARHVGAARLSARGLEALLTDLAGELTSSLALLGLAAPAWPEEPAARLAEIRRQLPLAGRRREDALRRAYEERSRLAVARARLEGAGEVADVGAATPTPTNPQMDLPAVEQQLADWRGRRDRWERLQREAAELRATLAASHDRVQALTAQREALGRAGVLERLQRELAALTNEGKSRRNQARLILDALEAVVASPSDHCPVCGQSVVHAELRRHLQEETASTQDRQRLEALRGRYRQLDEQRRRLKEVEAALTTAQEAVKAGQSNLNVATGAITNLLSAQLPAGTDEAGAVASEPFAAAITALEEQRATLREAVHHRQAQRSGEAIRHAALEDLRALLDLSTPLAAADMLRRAQERQASLDAEVARLESLGGRLAALGDTRQVAMAVLDYLDLKANVEAAEQRRPEAETRMTALEEAHARLIGLQGGLQAIHAAATALGEDRLQAALDSVLPLANQYFDRLGGHPAYAALTLQPHQQRGSSVYVLLAHDRDLDHATFLPTRLSHTQIHVAALAVFFALARHPLHHLDLLLLDDPAQSMDTERRKALVTMLGQEARERQIIVTTEDAAFADTIAQAGEALHRVQLAEWDSGGVQLEN